jgi:hypothetical protein
VAVSAKPHVEAVVSEWKGSVIIASVISANLLSLDTSGLKTRSGAELFA